MKKNLSMQLVIYITIAKNKIMVYIAKLCDICQITNNLLDNMIALCNVCHTSGCIYCDSPYPPVTMADLRKRLGCMSSSNLSQLGSGRFYILNNLNF